jgi:hypothetical protein
MILRIVVIGRFFEGRTQVVTAQPRRTISTNVKVNPPIPFFFLFAPLSRTSWISINPSCGLCTPYFQGWGTESNLMSLHLQLGGCLLLVLCARLAGGAETLVVAGAATPLFSDRTTSLLFNRNTFELRPGSRPAATSLVETHKTSPGRESCRYCGG